MSKTQLNEGLLNRIGEGIFKLLFKGQLKQAETFVKKVSSKMTDEDRAKLKKNLTDFEDASKKLNKLLDSMEGK